MGKGGVLSRERQESDETAWAEIWEGAENSPERAELWQPAPTPIGLG